LAGSRVESKADFNQAFKGIIDDIEPGRWSRIRPPSQKERNATALLKLTITEGSYKGRGLPFSPRVALGDAGP